MDQITYSRGSNIRDNAPVTRTAASFEAFVDALDQDRAADKAAPPYNAAAKNGTRRPCATRAPRTAPDCAAQRVSAGFGGSEGACP